MNDVTKNPDDAPSLPVPAPRISVVVPVYNEEEYLAEFLDKSTALGQELKNAGGALEVVLVDDGSSDDSVQIMNRFVERHPDDFVLLVNQTNRGYGATLKRGFHSASHDLIGIIDADGTYDIEQFSSFINCISDTPQCAMIVGNRHMKGNKIPFIRRPPKWMLRKLSEYLVARRIPDLNSGMRLMRTDVLMRYITLLPDRFSLTTTVTLAMMADNFEVEYLPIEYHKRKGKSSIRPVRDVVEFFQLIIRTTLYFNPLKVFFPLSMLFVLLSFAVAILSYLYTPKVMDITTIVLFLAGVQILGIGMLADLIVKRFKNSG